MKTIRAHIIMRLDYSPPYFAREKEGICFPGFLINNKNPDNNIRKYSFQPDEIIILYASERSVVLHKHPYCRNQNLR